MKISQILKKAVVSEKAHKQMEKGIYTFLVAKQATKKTISAAVKNQFGVDSVQVNISKVLPKTKRVTGTRKQTQVGGGKKAIITLKAGQSIAILSPKVESGKSQKSKNAEGKET